MLVLTRKAKQTIHIGRLITVTVLRIKGRTVKIGIQAPSEMEVLRGELVAEQPLPPPSLTRPTGTIPCRGHRPNRSFDLCWPLGYNELDTVEGKRWGP